MTEHKIPVDLACLIAGRNLGDIVVLSGFLRRLAARNYAKRYLVWTRPELAFLFSDIPDCAVICSQFPVGTAKRFDLRAALIFFKTALAIRTRRPSITLDLVGDIRERLFARLVGSPRHIHIGWERDHPHNRLIRNPFGPGRPVVSIPVSIPGVYAAYQRMLDLLAPESKGEEADPPDALRKVACTVALRVGIHPFASQPSKLWPIINWQFVIRELLSRGAELTVFCAPTEIEKSRFLLAEFGTRVPIFSGTIPEFARAITSLDVVVGLDSFAVHMAHRQGVRSIAINAGTPIELWAVPGGRTLGGSGGCAHYPCYNVAPCQTTPYEYACVKSVSPKQVLEAIAMWTDDRAVLANPCQYNKQCR